MVVGGNACKCVVVCCSAWYYMVRYGVLCVVVIGMVVHGSVW